MRMLLHDRIRDSYVHPQFISDVIKPLQIEPLFDQEVGRGSQYSGGCFLVVSYYCGQVDRQKKQRIEVRTNV